MTEKQKSFIDPTWQIGDKVIVNDKQGTIKLFHPRVQKVQIEFIGEDGNYPEWIPITDLPDYPTAATVPDGDTQPIPALTPPTSPAPSQPFPEWIHELKDADPDEGDEEADDQPKEIEFPKPEPAAATQKYPIGYTIESAGGVKWEVKSCDKNGLYTLLVHNLKGENFTIEKTEDEVRKFEQIISPASKPDPVVADMIEKIQTVSDHIITPATKESQWRQVYHHACFIRRDQDGFHDEEATQKLQEITNQGWQLQYTSDQTIWIPARSKVEPSYVETVTYWRFTRTVKVES